MLVVFGAFGALCMYLFHVGEYLPIWTSLAVMGVVAVYITHEYRQKRFGPLTLLLCVVFLLPFMHVISYLWFDFEGPKPMRMWGLAVNPYMVDRATIELMAMMGAVGAAGLALGAGLMSGKIPALMSRSSVVASANARKTLSMPVFIGWIVMSILLSWISAPAEMLFTAEYGESKALESGWNFSSAWMISYGFLIFALADSMFEPDAAAAKHKRRLIVAAMLIIVVWFQLLRGDRESLPLVLAVILVYYVWGKGLLPASVQPRLSKLTLALLALAVFTSAYFVGKLRHNLTNVEDTGDLLDVVNDSGAGSLDNAITGTWSAVLLTPLSISGDYVSGRSSAPAFGATYVDFVGSTLPGFVADWIGYERPIDASRGPAHEMRYGQGGTHAVVVPFLNLRMAGVFLIVAIWSCLLAALERSVLRQVSVSRLALLGILAMAAPHWLWYGEKSLLTASMIWAILATAHTIVKQQPGRYRLLQRARGVSIAGGQRDSAATGS